MTCQTLNAPPAGVTAYLVAGSTTTMLAEGLPEGARLEFAASADGPVLLSLEGVVGDAVTAFELTARQVDDLIARGARYIRIATGDGDTLHVLAAGRVWERSGWSGECGRTQVVTRLVAGPPGRKGDTGADGRGIESITDDDGDGIATVLYTDGVTGALPLPRGPQGDPAPPPEIAWAGDVLTVDGVSSPPLSGPAGPAPDTSWSGTSLIVGDNPPVNLRGPMGERGPVGSPGAVATASDYLLVGPGRPDTPATTGGIITGSEPVGCEFRSTDGAGVGAWVWSKRPTGWVVTDGDTGLRKLAPLDAGGAAFIRRSGDYVYFNWAGNAVDTTQLLLWEVITGFRTNHRMFDSNGGWYSMSPISNENGLSTSGWIGYGHNRGLHRVMIHPSNRASLKGGMSWQAYNDPWPTTLPGSPA